MTTSDRDNPEPTNRSAQTVHRLKEAKRQRDEQAHEQKTSARPTGPLREDPMMSLPDRPRRKRCKHCRYRFDYRMHTNRCPECGRYRDDYPHPNHGLQAMLFSLAIVGAVCAVMVVILVLREM